MKIRVGDSVSRLTASDRQEIGQPRIFCQWWDVLKEVMGRVSVLVIRLSHLKGKLRWSTEAIPEGLSSTPTSCAIAKTRDILHKAWSVPV